MTYYYLKSIREMYSFNSRCAQCFQPFENGLYFEVSYQMLNFSSLKLLFCISKHEGRKYCEKDFQMLFSPCCTECSKYYHLILLLIFLSLFRTSYHWSSYSSTSKMFSSWLFSLSFMSYIITWNRFYEE
jgi:hypothetical protein